ncbi:MAG: nrdD protein [Tenericutes bacterium]|nr:nrdD protein [Mycoplasmatota bacterium]
MLGGKEMDKEKKVKTTGEGVGFERIRRITGYLVGTVDRFNNAKKSEVNDRVKHPGVK